MTYEELEKKVLDLFPEAEIDEGFDGQIIIYTNLQIDPEGDGEELISLSELELRDYA